MTTVGNEMIKGRFAGEIEKITLTPEEEKEAIYERKRKKYFHEKHTNPPLYYFIPE